MARSNKRNVITAQEIACFAYCPEAWRLERGLGLEPGNRAALEAGERHHERKAAVERVAGGFIGTGRLVAVLAVMMLLLLLGAVPMMATRGWGLGWSWLCCSGCCWCSLGSGCVVVARVPGRVALGDCSPRAPTDPYVPFQAYGSSRHEHATGRHEVRPVPGPAIRCRFVSTVLGFDAPAMFPSNGVMTWRPLFSTGSLGMVPPLQRYCGTLRLPAVLLDPFDIFTSQYHRFARGLLPSAGGVPPGARELSVPVSPSGISMETSGSLRFPGNPDGHCPCSSTPAGSGRLSGPRVSCLTRPPPVSTTKAPSVLYFRGSITRPLTWLSTLRRVSRPTATQDSLLAAGPALPGGIRTRRISMKGFRVRVSSSSPELT